MDRLRSGKFISLSDLMHFSSGSLEIGLSEHLLMASLCQVHEYVRYWSLCHICV